MDTLFLKQPIGKDVVLTEKEYKKIEAMIKPGDRVRIVTKEIEHIGMMIQRPLLLNDNIITLKLDSGYNIGIDESTILKAFKEDLRKWI